MALTCALTFATNLAPNDLVRSLLYPVKYADLVQDSSTRHGVDPYLVCAVIKCESGWDSEASSSAGAVGLMQLMPATSAEVAQMGLVDAGTYDPNNLTDPATNIEYGTAYLAYLQQYLGSTDEVIAAYNAGMGTVGTWVGDGGDLSSSIEYAETAAYLVLVKDAYSRYQQLYPEGITA
jgi:soluble lytic murein transglycosylase